MNRFEYVQANDVQEAVGYLTDHYSKTKLMAGGMDLLGELKDHLYEPERLIGIQEIADLNLIKNGGGSLTLGATVTLAEIAENASIQKSYTALAEAASVVGSPQIRNVGTLGGNLCQRPRCWYYRGEFYHCLKKGGSLCYSVAGRNKYHAILGGTPCFIVHPSDLAPVLMALNATLHLLGPEGERTLPIEEFFVRPEQNLLRENVLKANEMITLVEVPSTPMKSTYVKFREKEGFDWSLSSAAVALELDGAHCKKASIVLGGVAPVPWRVKKTETLLTGKTITEELARQAGEIAVDGAEPMSENAYKISLTKTIVQDAILKLIAG